MLFCISPSAVVVKYNKRAVCWCYLAETALLLKAGSGKHFNNHGPNLLEFSYAAGEASSVSPSGSASNLSGSGVISPFKAC